MRLFLPHLASVRRQRHHSSDILDKKKTTSLQETKLLVCGDFRKLGSLSWQGSVEGAKAPWRYYPRSLEQIIQFLLTLLFLIFVLPSEMAMALKLPETGVFTFSSVDGENGAIPLTLESEYFRAFETLFVDQGRLCIATYPAYEPNMGKLSKALPSSIRFINATFKDDEIRIETVHYAVVSFNYTAFSDDKIEGIITVLVNPLNGSVTRISKDQLTLCGQLSDVSDVNGYDHLTKRGAMPFP